MQLRNACLLPLLTLLVSPLEVRGDDRLSLVERLVTQVFVEPLRVPDPELSIRTTYVPGEKPTLFFVSLASHPPCGEGSALPQLDITVRIAGGNVVGFSADGPLVGAQASLSPSEQLQRRNLAVKAISAVVGAPLRLAPAPNPRETGGFYALFGSVGSLPDPTCRFAAPGVAPTYFGMPF